MFGWAMTPHTRWTHPGIWTGFDSMLPDLSSNCAIIPSKPKTIIESALLQLHPTCITQPREPFSNTHWAPKSTACHPFEKTESDLHLQSFPARQTHWPSHPPTTELPIGPSGRREALTIWLVQTLVSLIIAPFRCHFGSGHLDQNNTNATYWPKHKYAHL